MADAKTDALVEALATARLQIDTAVGHLAAAGQLSSTQLDRLRARADQNTGCQNSGCGGAEAAVASKTQPG
jgi:hypothetical protein